MPTEETAREANSSLNERSRSGPADQPRPGAAGLSLLLCGAPGASGIGASLGSAHSASCFAGRGYAAQMPLADAELVLRPFRRDDETALERILAEPEVKRWWPAPDYVSERGWVIELAGEPAGWLEYHEEDQHWFPSVSFDIFIAQRLHGQGVGRRALRLGIEHFVAKGHHRFTLDPNARNERAIRSYRALGFEPVGVMRSYERRPEGGWDDALLMELIVAEAIERDARRGAARRA